MTLEYEEIKDMENKKEDKVNHPKHYTWLKDLCGIEVIDITRHMGFNLGNVIKYVLRAGHKNEEGYSTSDKELEDLKKARWYLDDEIKTRSKEDDPSNAVIAKLEGEINALKFQLKLLESEKTIGQIKINDVEVNNIINVLNQGNPTYPVTITQTSGSGIGLGLNLTYKETNGPEKSVDVTDYKAW